MNYLAAEFGLIPRLGKNLRDFRIRWKEVKDWKKWFSTLQILIATLLRGANLSMEFIGFGLLGASSVTGAIAASLDAVETHYYWKGSGRYAGTEKHCEGCANFMVAVTVACALAGLGCILASVLCWFLAYLFLGLSCLWFFSTDVEFFERMAIMIADKQEEIGIVSATTPKLADADYVQAFEEDKARKMNKLAAELQELITKKEREMEVRARRNGTASTKVVPVDCETAVGAAIVLPTAEATVYAQPYQAPIIGVIQERPQAEVDGDVTKIYP
jgi:hypothetical protein